MRKARNDVELGDSAQTLLTMLQASTKPMRTTDIATAPAYKAYKRPPQGLGRDLRTLKGRGLIKRVGDKRYLATAGPTSSIPLDAIPARRKTASRRTAHAPPDSREALALRLIDAALALINGAKP